MKHILLFCLLVSVAAADAQAPFLPRERVPSNPAYAAWLATQSPEAIAARKQAIKDAIARLKASAATNQDIADILTLLKAINQDLNQ